MVYLHEWPNGMRMNRYHELTREVLGRYIPAPSMVRGSAVATCVGQPLDFILWPQQRLPVHSIPLKIGTAFLSSAVKFQSRLM